MAVKRRSRNPFIPDREFPVAERGEEYDFEYILELHGEIHSSRCRLQPLYCQGISVMRRTCREFPSDGELKKGGNTNDAFVLFVGTEVFLFQRNKKALRATIRTNAHLPFCIIYFYLKKEKKL